MVKEKYMKIICKHYTSKEVKSITSDENCNCDLGLRCPEVFQCPQYETTEENKQNEMLNK
jgi:hypothetical protein